MAKATLTSKGQITLPKKIREHLKLHSGDQIEFLIQQDGGVTVRPASIPVSELKGILHRKGTKPVSVERMNQVIGKRFANLK